jgi:hypothetical protein
MDHFHAAESVRALGREAGPDASAWTRLVDEVAAWPDTGLITHEFFCAASSEQAGQAVEALQPADVHLLLTARDYVRQFPAVWQEALKMRADLSLDEYLDRALRDELPGPWTWLTQDVAAILDRWAGWVPPDHVHLVTVPPRGAPRGLLWERWCSVLGLAPDRFDLDVAFGNESLGLQQAALLRRVKPALSESLRSNTELYRWVRQYFGHEVLVPQGGERFGLRAHHADQLTDRARQMVSVAAAAGYDVVGELDELIPRPELTAGGPNPGDVNDSEMLDVAVVAIDQMIRDVRRLTRQRDDLARRRPRNERGWEPDMLARAGRDRSRLASALRGRVGAARRTLTAWTATARRRRRS